MRSRSGDLVPLNDALNRPKLLKILPIDFRVMGLAMIVTMVLLLLRCYEAAFVSAVVILAVGWSITRNDPAYIVFVFLSFFQAPYYDPGKPYKD